MQHGGPALAHSVGFKKEHKIKMADFLASA